MRIVASLVGLALSAASAVAADLNVPVNELHTRLNSFTRANKIDLRASRLGCDTGVKTVCQYKISTAVGILTSSDAPGGMAKEVTVLYGSDKPADALQGLLAYTAVIAVLSPYAKPEQRGDLIMSLFRGIEDSGDKESAELGSVKYTMMSVKGLGLWFIAAPVDP